MKGACWWVWWWYTAEHDNRLWLSHLPGRPGIQELARKEVQSAIQAFLKLQQSSQTSWTECQQKLTPTQLDLLNDNKGKLSYFSWVFPCWEAAGSNKYQHMHAISSFLAFTNWVAFNNLKVLRAPLACISPHFDLGIERERYTRTDICVSHIMTTNMYTHTRTHTHINTYIYTHSTYLHTHVYIHTYIHTYIHIYIHPYKERERKTYQYVQRSMKRHIYAHCTAKRPR